jgi:hypothetical protein
MRKTLHLIAGLLFALAGCRTATVSEAAPRTSRGETPQIRSPKDQQHIGAEGDPLCEEAQKACTKIRVEIFVPKGLTPFLAVEPMLIAPKMFIQPPIHGVRSDGTASALVYLGKNDNGARQWFKIHLFACKDENRFREAEQILHFPSDCAVADPVEVYRER